MRKLFLLCALAFAVYYGASLWRFADVEAMKQYVNWLPLGILVLFFLLGLIHMRFGLGLGLALILLLGNPTLLNELVQRVPKVGAQLAVFGQLGQSIESILLGLFAAWALLRMFGNPELDYEYKRAHAVRALHFAVFVVGFTAVLAAIHAVVLGVNVWSQSTREAMREALVKHPYGFLRGEGGLGPIRAVITFLESIAVYTIVTNEVRTAREVRGYLRLLLVVGMLVAAAGLAQSALGLSFGSGLWRYNQEIHGTFGDPNSFAVFLMALLPISVGLILGGRWSGIVGIVTTLVLMAAIVKSDTKLAIFVSVVYLVGVALVVIGRAVRRGQVYPLILTAIVLVVLLGAYGAAKYYGRGENAREWAKAVVKKVDGTIAAFVRGKWDWASLNQRTNYKLGDHLTALRMVDPREVDGGKRLVAGVGWGRFAGEYDKYRSKVASSRGREGASNMVLQVLAEAGFFGALALVLIVVFAAWWAWRAAEELDYPAYGKALVWALLMVVIGCMTENAFMRPQIQVVFWLLVGLCMVQKSVVAGEPSVRGGAFVRGLILLLIVGAWAWVMYPLVLTQRSHYAELKAVAQDGAQRYKLDFGKLLASLEKTGDYGFNRKGPDRWSEREAYVLSKVTGPVMAFTIGCAHPSVTVTNPVRARISIHGVVVTNVVFTNTYERQSFEVDLRTRPQLRAVVENRESVLVRVQVNRTWVPAEHYPQFKEDTFQVGVAVSPITWKEELTPPAAAPAEPSEAQAGAGASEEAGAESEGRKERAEEAAEAAGMIGTGTNAPGTPQAPEKPQP